MSVGTNNHYRIGEITPRHFLQTADRCKFDATIIKQTLQVLLDTAAASAEKTIAALGNTIPAELGSSALAGINARLNAIALWKKSVDHT